MTINELLNQFEIQGAFCIKRWRDDWNDYTVFAEGEDFECDRWNMRDNECFNFKISYMYAVDGVLNIELECD